MVSQRYPGASAAATYQYDAMGHLSGMTDTNNNLTASATYGPAGEMDSLNYTGINETFTYNSLWQLTRMTANQLSYPTGMVMDMSYIYTAGQNNGRISASADWVSGETVNYTYDSLNRLASASASNGAWGNTHTYDGFGNLTAKTVTAGSALNSVSLLLQAWGNPL
jgi:hypothetical protein